MVNISDRWNRDKTDDLQFAFFNGVGWEAWENIWGIWNGITSARCRSHAPHGYDGARVCSIPQSARLGAAIRRCCAMAFLPAGGRLVNRLCGPS